MTTKNKLAEIRKIVSRLGKEYKCNPIEVEEKEAFNSYAFNAFSPQFYSTEIAKIAGACEAFGFMYYVCAEDNKVLRLRVFGTESK